MTAYVAIDETDYHIWVRFENMKRHQFEALLDAFRSSFPLSDWDEERKAWRLSVKHLPAVKHFCVEALGKHCLKLQKHDNGFPAFRQLSML